MAHTSNFILKYNNAFSKHIHPSRFTRHGVSVNSIPFPCLNSQSPDKTKEINWDKISCGLNLQVSECFYTEL